MQRGRMPVIPAVAILSVGILLLFYMPILRGVGDFLLVEDELQPADVIHVISGEDYRAAYGIQLYEKGYGKFLFFTGGWCPYHNINHAQHSREMALALGIPADAIVTDEAEISSTYAEANRLKEWIEHQSEAIQSIIVVSDAFHMRRAQWTYRRIFGDQVKILMAPVPFEMTPYKRDWWTDGPSRQYVESEYIKMAYYILRYQFGGGPFKEWLISLDRE
jgi:uncharacterized SAM-binding protein YcdF (DUF218 family)